LCFCVLCIAYFVVYIEHDENSGGGGGAKHGYSDGSIESDLPMEQLSELFNVNHFIVSQVNPHTAILSSMTTKATVWSNPVYGALVGYMRFLSSQIRDWLKNIVNFVIFRSNAPHWSNRRGLVQALTQDYEGRDYDITIMPWYNHISPFTAISSVIKVTSSLLYQLFLSNETPLLVIIESHTSRIC